MWAIGFFLAIATAFADVSGPVVSVFDGDTIEVLRSKRPVCIRFEGIVSPEKGQPHSKKAKQAASALVLGKEVILQTYGKYKYRRTLGDMLLPHGTNVNYELVKECCWWWYRKDAPRNAILEELETRARASGIGLWADPHPVPLWERRKKWAEAAGYRQEGNRP